MATAFYLLKIGKGVDGIIDSIKGLKGRYSVDYVEEVFGEYDAIVKVRGTYPTDIIDFWMDANKIKGIRVVNKLLALDFGEKWK